MIAVAIGKTTLLLWSTAVGAMAVATMAWAGFAWTRVGVDARFEPRRAFAGERVALKVLIRNGKPLPLPVVRVGVWLPPGIRTMDGEVITIRGFHRQLSMPGRSEALLDLPVEVRSRGEYWLDRIEIELADPFDLAPLRREHFPGADLMVMPEPRITVPAEVRRRLPFGMPARTARMFETRERFAGTRPYEPGDPLNRIHWKLSGHAGVLQTKLFEPTRNADVILALDIAVGEPFWDAVYPEIAEDTIGWGSFLSRQAIQNGWRVGLVANTHLTRGRGPLRVPPSSAKGNEPALFSALARMPNEPTSDLAPVLREAGRSMDRNTTAVVISPRPGARLWHEVIELRRRGVEVVTLSPLDARLVEAGL